MPRGGMATAVHRGHPREKPAAAADDPIASAPVQGPATLSRAPARESRDESLAPVAAIPPDGRVQRLPDRNPPDARGRFKQY